MSAIITYHHTESDIYHINLSSALQVFWFILNHSSSFSKRKDLRIWLLEKDCIWSLKSLKLLLCWLIVWRQEIWFHAQFLFLWYSVFWINDCYFQDTSRCILNLVLVKLINSLSARWLLMIHKCDVFTKYTQ